MSRSIVRDKAASCHFCPHAVRERSWWTGGATACGVSGLPITKHVSIEGECPKGRFPDPETTICKRLFIRWYGVPFYERLALRLFHRSKPPYYGFSGCGCIVRLKDMVHRISHSRIFRALRGSHGNPS